MVKLSSLTAAQQYIVKLIRDLKGGFIYVSCRRKWKYYLARDTGEPIIHTRHYRIRHPQTIRALIRKGVLIPEMDDKEFEVQLALGSIDWRVYNLAEEFDKC